jgi:hypothetical protein
VQVNQKMIRIDERSYLTPTQVKELLTSTKRVKDKDFPYIKITRKMVEELTRKKTKKF